MCQGCLIRVGHNVGVCRQAEADEHVFHTYRCEECDIEKPVEVNFDLCDRQLYPVNYDDTKCPICGDFMDKEE